MHVRVNAALSLAPFRREDAEACVTLLSEREIYERTLRVPHPYHRHHYIEWFEQCQQSTQPLVQLAIRDAQDWLLGGIGTQDLVPGHKSGFGYWLGKPFWGRGFMTDAVGAFCEHLHQQYHLARMWATVFDGNDASVRVLEKNGFTEEGFLKKHYRKEGQLLDGRLFAKIW